MIRILFNSMYMKRRVSLTIDPVVMQQARRLAHEMNTSVSQLVEESLQRLSQTPNGKHKSFIEQWRGKLKLAQRDLKDPRREYLLKRYGFINANSH